MQATSADLTNFKCEILAYRSKICNLWHGKKRWKFVAFNDFLYNSHGQPKSARGCDDEDQKKKIFSKDLVNFSPKLLYFKGPATNCKILNDIRINESANK